MVSPEFCNEVIDEIDRLTAERDRALDRIAAAPKPEDAAPTPPSVPDGFVLVPIEPTREMLFAGGNNAESGQNFEAYLPSECAAIYRDMLAAAPKPGDSPSRKRGSTMKLLKLAQAAGALMFLYGVFVVFSAEGVSDDLHAYRMIVFGFAIYVLFRFAVWMKRD